MRLNAVSIHPLLKLIQIDEAGVINLPCFNTSHVKVNLSNKIATFTNDICFNTSHVKVNRLSLCQNLLFCKGFNTSHVKVNRR